MSQFITKFVSNFFSKNKQMNKTKMCVFSGKCFKEKYFYNQTRPDLDNMADFSHWAMAYISDQQMSFQFNNCIEKVKGDSREENYPSGRFGGNLK